MTFEKMRVTEVFIHLDIFPLAVTNAKTKELENASFNRVVIYNSYSVVGVCCCQRFANLPCR